jgi:hypothetical protein
VNRALPEWYAARLEADALYVQARAERESWFADPWFEPTDTAELVPGEVVRVAVRGVWHEGIVSDRRETDGPWVISKSKRAGVVAEEPWPTFSAGRPVERVGRFGPLPVEHVLERARARLGERWTPWAHCQRFTRECYGLRSVAVVSGELPAWFDR